MGKKTRKTRWRTLSISGAQSDSEEQSQEAFYGGQYRTGRDPGHGGHNGYGRHHSSQSTPVRHACPRPGGGPGDYGPKSTRSSSTASDNKITFNEDEYTRITTPRQDVLFKKGYLSKPKPYLQQHHQSFGGGSTGGSTGNGTPDHHSADGTESTESIEYEQSPFIYPNGFIDHNGICYINGVPCLEPFPGFVVYNTGPVCYPPYVPSRVKRYSTDSMTESTSPNTEPQEQYPDGEVGTNGHSQDFTNQHPMFNFVYPGYVYGNGVYPHQEVVQNDVHSTDPRRLKKKRRRRKISRSKPPNEETTNGYSDEEYSSEDEVLSQSEESVDQSESSKHRSTDLTPPTQPTDAHVHATSETATKSLPVIANGHSPDQLQPSTEHKPSENPDNSRVADQTSAQIDSLDNTSHSSLSDHSDVTQSEGGVELRQITAQTDECVSQQLTVETSAVPNDQSQPSKALDSQPDAPVSTNEIPLVNNIDESNSQLPSEAVTVGSNRIDGSGTSNAVDTSTVALDNTDIETTSNVDVSNENVNSELTNVLQTDVENAQVNGETTVTSKPKYRVDAEEFVPRAYRQNYDHHVPVTNFIPLPVDMFPHNFPNHAFIPPINFIPGVHQFIPNQYFINQEQFYMRNHHIEVTEKVEEKAIEERESTPEVENKEEENAVVEEEKQVLKEKTEEVPVQQNPVDIAKIVNKLEEAMEQKKTDLPQSPVKQFRNNQRNYHKTESRTSPRKYIDRRQNSYDRAPKKQPEVKIEPKIEPETQPEAPKQVPVKPEPEEIKPKPTELVEPAKEELKIEPQPVKLEPTFSKMLKSSISMIENKSNDFRPLYKKQTSLNGTKAAPTPVKDTANLKNYSDTVKKQYKRNDSNQFCPRYDRNRRTSDGSDKRVNKFEENVKKLEVKKAETKPVSPDSWISVSSRKKRKNKAGVMSNDSNDSFEPMEEVVSEVNNIEIEPSIEIYVAEIEKTYEMQEKAQQKTINEVVVEKEEVNIEEPKIEEVKVEVVIEKVETPVVVIETSTAPVIKNENKKPKKNEKSKNKITKNKRIIINDKELQSKNNTKTIDTKIPTKVEIQPEVVVIEEPKPEEKEEIVLIPEEETKVEEVIEEIVQPIEEIELPQEIEIISNNEEALEVKESEVIIKIDETQEIIEEEPMKEEVIEEQKTEATKSKKKKRKSKPNKQSSPSITSADESYDFLMESNSFADPELKTNVEVSLEIDRMIQRGLYANLEGKLKTVNPSDSFIQSVATEDFNFDIAKTLENTNAFRGIDKLKNFDFSQVLFNTTMNKTFEKVMVNKNASEEKKTEKKVEAGLKKTTNVNNSESIDELQCNGVCDNKNVNNEIKINGIEDSTITNGNNLEVTNGPVNLSNGQLLPITKAVKEWMNKTRENTPEVELLKSVNEIRSEYLVCHDLNESGEDSEEEVPKNAEGLPVRATSVSNGIANGFHDRTRESHENTPDLLECWESDIEIKNYDNKLIELKKRKIFNGDLYVQNGIVPEQNGHIETGEDVLEVYESVYGKNEDYLRIQKEIEGKKSETKSLNFPKDGGLPYRAICCSVM